MEGHVEGYRQFVTVDEYKLETIDKLDGGQMMEGIMNILTFCFRVGVVIVCILLVAFGILRWLAHRRTKRLKIASWIAFVVLCIITLVNNKDSFFTSMGGQNRAELTIACVNTAKITIKLLILGAIVGFVIMLLCCVFYFMYSVLNAVYKHHKKGDSLLCQFNEKSEVIKELIRTPIGILVITGGIIALFAVAPILMGDHNNSSMADTWVTGVKNIASLADPDKEKYEKPVAEKIERLLGKEEEHYEKSIIKNCDKGKTPFYNALTEYILIFIIVMGAGFVAIKILYSIINRTMENTSDKLLLAEYSGSIGVLSVGVALLWTMQRRDFLNDSPMKLLSDCTMSFIMVTFIVVASILTFEFIYLLMDMWEKLIRQEARYLFISLVGQVSLLLLGATNSIYEAVSNAIGTAANSNMDNMDEVYEKMQRKMIETMREQIEEPAGKNRRDEMVVFPSFSEKVTKK